MKKVAMKAITIGLLLISLQVNASANNEITIAYEDKEQPPYYMGNTTEVLTTNPGAAVEIVKMLEKRIPGLKITFVRYPWKRCLASLGNNTVDGIFNSSYKEERLEIGWYPTIDKKHKGKPDIRRRLCTITYSLYTLKGVSTGWDGNKFNNFNGKITAPLGYSIIDDLKKMGVDVEEAPSTTNNLDKIINKRVEATALQDVTADSIIKKQKNKYTDIVKIAPALSNKHYYLMLSKKFVDQNPALAQMIWNEIANIREEQLEKLSARYND